MGPRLHAIHAQQVLHVLYYFLKLIAKTRRCLICELRKKNAESKNTQAKIIKLPKLSLRHAIDPTSEN